MTDPHDKQSPDEVEPEIRRAEAEIERARESVFRSITALERQISQTFDWREWIRRRPFWAMAGAFGVGALLGSLGGGRRRHR